MVAYTYLERMQVSINDTLELFDAPFRVTASEDLGFDARFDDGRTVMDRRLSVGERIVLAMAFRITINSTFASSLGVLIMDEPTAGLDEHNLGCLPQALERLRALSDSCGLQILFVTHEPRISHLFDKVIDLSNAS
jgi:DNA repair exonuclease SbcCD ATPase subunit